eukprot:g7236.t1
MGSSRTAHVAAGTERRRSKAREVSFFTYLREFVSGTAMLLQDMPVTVATEAAGLIKDVPIVGMVCKSFLSFEQLVQTARSNKDDLAVLLELCDVVITGVLDNRSERPVLFKGFVALEKHVKKAGKVAKRCNGVGIKDKMRQFVLARSICRDIVSVRNDVLAFCTANNLVLANDIHSKVDNLEAFLAMETFLADKLQVAEEELKSTQNDLEAMKRDVEAKAKQLEDRDKKLATRDKTSLKLEAALRSSMAALAALETKYEEQRRVVALANRVKVPPGAPRLRDWYVEREAVVAEACHGLGIVGSSTEDTATASSSSSSSSEEPRMVGLAGPSGAGKSTVASMIIAREDLRTFFHSGIMWLQVGRGAKNRLPELMIRLAGMVHQTVMLGACRPPRKSGFGLDPENGVAYIREVVDESSRQFLVVADDVWEVEVLEALRMAGAWVLYTSSRHDLLPEPPIRLDQVLQEEAEMVLRRAAELDDDEKLPRAAYDMMSRCEFGASCLVFVGRWSAVRGRSDEKTWRTAFGRVAKIQKRGEGGKPLSWRAAALRAGLEELASDNPLSKELYLSLAVVPKGLAFPSEVAAVLLYGNDLSAEDLEAAAGALATLERWSILTLEDGGKYRVRDEHAGFIQGRFAADEDVRATALPRWRGYLSSVEALLTFSSAWLVDAWDALSRADGGGVPARPYDAALAAMGASSADRPPALETAAHYDGRRRDWSEAYTKLSQVLLIQENSGGGNSLDAAGTLNQLGACAMKAGREAEAEGCYRRALSIQERKVGVQHSDAAGTLVELGRCAERAGRAEEAEESYRRALVLQEERVGADHPDVATTLSCLGVCASKAGRVEEAEELLRRALAIREEKLGVDHPDVADALYRLGVCAYKDGRTKEAQGLHRRALAIREEKLRVDHPHLASTLYRLGECVNKAGATEEAGELFQQAFSIDKQLRGVDHSNVASTLHFLGECAYQARRVEEAEEFYRQALPFLEKKLGADHLNVANTLNNVGLCAGQAGKVEEAQVLFRRALSIREKRLGADHLNVANTLHCLGVGAYKTGKTAEAEEYLARALAIREKRMGAHHPNVASTLHDLGVCVGKTGRTEETSLFFRRALSIREDKLGPDHPSVADTLHELGVCAASAGRAGEAEECYRRALAILEGKPGELRRVADLARGVRVPAGAPRIRDWYVERKAVVDQVCDGLGIGSSPADTLSGEPRMVGLAGPSGAGKSTAASMVVAREDLRASFHKGVMWLQVGQGAIDCLAELMIRLADMVYETVMRKTCRPPRKAGIDTDPDDGVAYIREVVDQNSRRFLVVADDVWEMEVLEALRKAGLWVLYTTRDSSLLPEAAPVRLDQVLEKEAELVLRRACEIDDDARLPQAAYELMARSEFVVMDLALVGRWSVVRGRNDHQAWQRVLDRVVKAQDGGEGTMLLSWRAAVLRAGLEELACDHAQSKELYLSLAVIPKGISFPSKVAAVLLFDGDLSAKDLEAAADRTATLERWSILTLERGGRFRVHDQHADFVRGRLTANQDIRDRALRRWRGYISSVQALLSFSSSRLVKIWEVFALLAMQDIPSQPYDAALDAMDALSTDYLAVLGAVARFHWRQGNASEAFIKFSRLLVAQEDLSDGNGSLDVASTLYNLGVCASKAGRTEEAEGLYRRALTIREEKLGVDHPHVASTLHNLGVCALEAGKMEEAKGFLRRALTIREEKLGVDHPDVASTLMELGLCALRTGRTEEAEGLYRRALTIREKKLGVDHPDVASTLYNLGVFASKAGRTEEAEGLYRRALTIREEKLGVDHPHVAYTLHNLGVCVKRAGRTEEAEGLFRRALTIGEGKLGVDHPGMASTLKELRSCSGRARRTEVPDRGVVSTST